MEADSPTICSTGFVCTENDPLYRSAVLAHNFASSVEGHPLKVGRLTLELQLEVIS